MFFWQIWFQKLKFLKLTKIWYRRTLLYPYFEFNVSFFKIFIIHILFWHNSPQNLKFFKLTEIKYRRKLLYVYSVFNVYFFKKFLIHSFWTNLVRKICLSPNWLKFGAGVHCYMLITVSMFIFSKVLLFT